jgi:anti-anti-sigma factor
VNREFLVDRHDGEACVHLAGDLDVAALPAFHRAIERALASNLAYVVVVLDDVTFVDSSGLGALVDGHRKATSRRTCLRCTTPVVPIVQELFARTGVAWMVHERRPPLGHASAG